jgi:GNAT superfamily N-acetyltransferase
VEHLWVLPDFIGKGIGAKLFRRMLAKCREMGVKVLEIESDPNAQGFYERMGARKVGEVVSQVDGQPRVLPLLEIAI